MTDVIPDHADARAASSRTPSQSFTAPPPDTEDPARQVGEVFRRLSGCHATYGDIGFARVVAAVLVALGRAAMEESERQARRLRERTAPAGPGVRVSATARRVDFDAGTPANATDPASGSSEEHLMPDSLKPILHAAGRLPSPPAILVLTPSETPAGL